LGERRRRRAGDPRNPSEKERKKSGLPEGWRTPNPGRAT